MDDGRRMELDRRAEVISALAHASRLIIVEELEAGDRSVGALTDAVGSDMSTVSRHLSVLRSAGIVSSSRDGNRIIYHLQTPCITSFFDCVQRVIDETESCSCS